MKIQEKERITFISDLISYKILKKLPTIYDKSGDEFKFVSSKDIKNLNDLWDSYEKGRNSLDMDAFFFSEKNLEQENLPKVLKYRFDTGGVIFDELELEQLSNDISSSLWNSDICHYYCRVHVVQEIVNILENFVGSEKPNLDNFIEIFVFLNCEEFEKFNEDRFSNLKSIDYIYNVR